MVVKPMRVVHVPSGGHLLTIDERGVARINGRPVAQLFADGRRVGAGADDILRLKPDGKIVDPNDQPVGSLSIGTDGTLSVAGEVQGTFDDAGLFSMPAFPGGLRFEGSIEMRRAAMLALVFGPPPFVAPGFVDVSVEEVAPGAAADNRAPPSNHRWVFVTALIVYKQCLSEREVIDSQLAFLQAPSGKRHAPAGANGGKAMATRGGVHVDGFLRGNTRCEMGDGILVPPHKNSMPLTFLFAVPQAASLSMYTLGYRGGTAALRVSQ